MAAPLPLSKDTSRQILDHPVISERYFFPRRHPPDRTFWIQADGASLACSYLRPFPDALTVLFFHGNGEVVADYQGDFEDAFRSFGVNLCLAEYRGYGGSSGQPLLASMLDDTETIVHALGCPLSRLVVMGRSLGSLYAVETAFRFPSIAGLILESGIADLEERLLFRLAPHEVDATDDTFHAAISTLFDHQAKLASFHAPCLVLHTAHDSLVSARHALKNYTWASSPAKELVLFDHGDHNDILLQNWDLYWDKLRLFLQGIAAAASVP